MEKIINLFTPIKATIVPGGGTVNPGMVVVIDTNVPASVLYTLDGSDPKALAVGTFRADPPIEISVFVTTRVRFKAFDSRPAFRTNITKTQDALFEAFMPPIYDVSLYDAPLEGRNNPAESFRDTNYFYKRLVKSIVDENFYLTVGKWLLPISQRPFTYLFVNREPYPVRLRVLHNGIDIFPNYPFVLIDEAKEIPISPISGENTLEIQTSRGQVALYDSGIYDIDVYS